MKELVQKYSVQENCKQLVVTRVNPEVWRACSPKTRDNDLKLQQIQRSIVTSLRHLAILSDQLLNFSNMLGSTNLNELLNYCSDTIALICSANREINLKRREHIKPDLHFDYKLLCSQHVPITQFLFGDNLQGDLKEIKAT